MKMHLKGHYLRRWILPFLLACLLPGLGGCIHLHEISPVYLQSLSWSGLSPPPAPATAAFGPGACLLSLALALAYAGARFWRARRAAALRLEKGEALEREDLALARTARDALTPLVKRHSRRWRVVVLEEFRRDGRE